MYEFEHENGQKLKAEKKEQSWSVFSTEINFDDIKIKGEEVLFFSNHKLYRAHLLEYSKADKILKIVLEGKTHTLKIKDKYDHLLSQLGLSGMSTKKINELKSPMPGLVVEVLAKEGDSVKKGSPLVILEAMKMENVLKAVADVVIKKINVEKGVAVEKNQVLVVFE